MHAAAAYPAFSSAGVTDAQETAYQEVFAADKTVQRSVPSVFHWSPDGSQVAFVTGDASAAGDVPKGLGAEGQGPEVHVVDVATGRAVFQVPIDVLAQRVGRLCGQAVSAGQLAQSLLAIGPLGVRFMACEQLIDVDLRSGAPTVAQGVTPTDLAARRPRVIGSTFPKSAFFSNAILESAAPDGGAFFGVVNDNIYVRSVGGEPVLVAQDGDPARPWALESAVWSADGRSVAVLRRDNSAVATTPLVDWLDGYGVSTALPAPVAGAKLPMLDLYVIDVRAQKVRHLGREADGYWMIASLTPERVVVRSMSRRVDVHMVFAIDLKTGARTVLFEEQTDTFFTPFLYANSYMSLGADGFLWVPEDAAHRNIEHRDAGGQLVRRVTKRDLSMFDVLRIDRVAGYVYYTGPASPQRPYDRHLWRAPIAGGPEELLTPEPGQHVIQFSPAGSAFVDIYSDVNLPPRMILRDAAGAAIATLATSTITSADLWGEYPPEPFVVKAADGKTDLHGVLYKPRDFDPQKSYPLIQFVYGEPLVAITQRHFGPGQMTYGGSFVGSGYMNKAPALAQLGYITFTVDARGSFGRERGFHTAAYQGVGERDIADYRAAIEQLTYSRPYMDASRIGIYGRSFGGYMTVRGMLRAPDIYKVGVASVPLRLGADARAGMELYFGDPHKNPDVYVNASNEAHASGLAGKLFLILPTLGVEVPFEEGIRLVDAFVRAGKSIDMMVLPGQNAMFQYQDSPPYMEYRDDYRNGLIRDYFLKHLAP